MGLGVLLIQDKIGVNKNTEAHLTYSYKLIKGETTFSFGLQAGIINFTSDNEDLNPFDPQDPAFNGAQNYFKPALGAGIILKSERYFFGLSVPRMLNSSVTVEGIETSVYQQHFYAMAAYVFNLSERWRFKPSMLLKAVKGSPISLDYNATFNLDEKYTVGIFARNLNSLGLLTQIRFNEAYRLGYSFEVPLSNSVGTGFTTHEIVFGLNLAMFQGHSTSISNF
jgi:type IX secretion system PorP/SprF family membrane protein